MTKEYRGLIHIHSKYSFDGTLTLRELAALSKEKKIDFLVLTEHGDSDYFNPDKMAVLVEECDKLSNSEFLIIPGLEFNCENMHILAIGINEYLVEKTLEGLIDRIHEKGGLAVLAHLSYYNHIPYEKLVNLDGIEPWNNRYDGRFAPSIKSLKILSKFRKQNKNISAFSGLDLHDKKAVGTLSILAKTNGLNKEEIIKSLKEARFYSSNGFMRFNPKKDPSISKQLTFISIRLPYVIIGKATRLLSRTLKKITIN